jgi:hypothetical protein
MDEKKNGGGNVTFFVYLPFIMILAGAPGMTATASRADI